MKSVYIIGSKGIPAKFGGFETFVEKLTENQKDKNIKYYVACMRENSAKSNITDDIFEHNGATCFAMLGSAMSTIFNQCALMPAKREKKTLISSSTSALLNIGLNFILIPIFAEKGAAFTTVLAEFTMMTMNFYFSRDITGFVFKDKQTWKNIISIVVACVGIALICNLSSMTFNNIFVRLTASIVGSAFVYGVILLILRNKIALDAFNKFLVKRVRNH